MRVCLKENSILHIEVLKSRETGFHLFCSFRFSPKKEVKKNEKLLERRQRVLMWSQNERRHSCCIYWNGIKQIKRYLIDAVPLWIRPFTATNIWYIEYVAWKAKPRSDKTSRTNPFRIAFFFRSFETLGVIGFYTYNTRLCRSLFHSATEFYFAKLSSCVCGWHSASRSEMRISSRQQAAGSTYELILKFQKIFAFHHHRLSRSCTVESFFSVVIAVSFYSLSFVSRFASFT